MIAVPLSLGHARAPIAGFSAFNSLAKLATVAGVETT